MSATPIRTCVGCRQQVEQTSLHRLALSPTSGNVPTVVFDAKRSLPGRGAWIHTDQKCLSTALKKGAFNRAFKTRVSTAELVIEA